MDWQTKIGFAQIIAAAIPGIATLVLAILAYLHSRRTQQLQAINFYIGNWRELNRLFLQNDRARSVRASLVDQVASEQSDLNALVAIYINQALLAYYSWKFGVLNLADSKRSFARSGRYLEHLSYFCRALKGSLNQAFASSAVSIGSSSVMA